MNAKDDKKRLQVIFSNEAWANVDALTKEANRDFDVGTVSYSDVVNELVLTGKVDLKLLQVRRTDVRRSLRSLASQETVDLDSAIKTLMELKSKIGKKSQKHILTGEEVQHG